ncbi:hypothetical protein CLU79DRAFT_747424 [Phycomyces nitens]|nr:hypothetical protein CLU79DRAFT_747424 [Phycomyces nitens]
MLFSFKGLDRAYCKALMEQDKGGRLARILGAFIRQDKKTKVRVNRKSWVEAKIIKYHLLRELLKIFILIEKNVKLYNKRYKMKMLCIVEFIGECQNRSSHLQLLNTFILSL